MASDMSTNIVSHFFLTSGYLIDISPSIAIQPSFLLKYVGGSPLEGDLNAIIIMRNIAFGVSYRSNASINFLTEIKISERLKMGYSYEYSTNELNNFTNGSHEILLRYQIANKLKFVSPRYY